MNKLNNQTTTTTAQNGTEKIIGRCHLSSSSKSFNSIERVLPDELKNRQCGYEQKFEVGDLTTKGEITRVDKLENGSYAYYTKRGEYRDYELGMVAAKAEKLPTISELHSDGKLLLAANCGKEKIFALGDDYFKATFRGAFGGYVGTSGWNIEKVEIPTVYSDEFGV